MSGEETASGEWEMKCLARSFVSSGPALQENTVATSTSLQQVGIMHPAFLAAPRETARPLLLDVELEQAWRPSFSIICDNQLIQQQPCHEVLLDHALLAR